MQQSAELVLFNVLGEQVMQEAIWGNPAVNTEELQRGIYFYEVRVKNRVMQVGKLVKTAEY